MSVKLKPMGDFILIKPKEKETKSKGGLIVTDSVKRGQPTTGTVIAVGTGMISYSGDIIPLTVKEGDVVMYKQEMDGQTVKIEDTEYVLMKESELIGVLVDE